MKLGRHLIAGGSAVAWAVAIFFMWQGYSDQPISDFILSVVNDKVDVGEKVKVRYTFKIKRPCQAQLTILLNDGLETVRTYHADLYSTTEATQGDEEQANVIKEVGLPNFTSPGKLMLEPSVDFVCNKIHKLWPLHVKYPGVKVEVVDKVTLVRIATVAALSEDLSQVTQQLAQLKSEVDKLKPIRKSEIDIIGKGPSFSESKGPTPRAGNGAAATDGFSRIPPLPVRARPLMTPFEPPTGAQVVTRVEDTNNWVKHD
jgi:hypothetical protein